MARRLPPLTALRAFEAAGRHLSFTQAAAELHVTQAAISRQVRELEDWLKLPLFDRLHRQVALTEKGALLATALTRNLDSLAAVVRDLQTLDGEVVRLSVEPSLAACWLVPRLDRFHAAHPGIALSLDSSHALVRVGDDADLALRWSPDRSSWPGTQALLLAEALAFPVIAPGRLAAGPPVHRPVDLLGHTLLHEDSRDFWGRWFAEAGLTELAVPRGPVFNDLALAIDAAVRGQGVALADGPLVADDLAAGRLIRPFAIEIRLGAYWLLRPDGPLRPAVQVTMDWISSTMQIDSRPENGCISPT